MMYRIFWRVLYVGWQVIKTYIVVIMMTFCLDIVLRVDRRCLSCRKARYSNEFVISLVLNWNIPTAVDPRSLKFAYVRYTELFTMIVGVVTTCHTQCTSDRSICIFFLFISMGLRQGLGLCSSSSRKYPGTEGCYMPQTVGTKLIIVFMLVESQRVHI